MMYRYTLEKYSGQRSRHTCPGCGQKGQFTRYIDAATGTYLDDRVGICNRTVKCGYHYPPRQFFNDNPSNAIAAPNTDRQRSQKVELRDQADRSFDLVEKGVLLRTIDSQRRNNFLSFLETRFGVDAAAKAVKMYAIGTWPDERTVFWQIDSHWKIRTGKLMAYDADTGKRRKESRAVSWVHTELRRSSSVTERKFYGEFRLEQCTFGEHLIKTLPGLPIAVVEGEKSAVIASIFFPNYIWIATGGCKNLKLERLVRIAARRQIVLFPDSAQFASWSAQANDQNRLDGNIQVSDFLEKRLTETEKAKDIDIADIILGLHLGRAASTR